MVRALGYEVDYRRPAELATDTVAKIDAIRHVTEFVERTRGFFPDIVVDLDIGVPMREPQTSTGQLTRCGRTPRWTRSSPSIRRNGIPYSTWSSREANGYYGVVRRPRRRRCGGRTLRSVQRHPCRVWLEAGANGRDAPV